MIATLTILLTVALAAIIILIVLRKNDQRDILGLNDELSLQKDKLNKIALHADELTVKFKESELLARVVRQSPNAIMLMDKDGEIQSINRGFTEMYEYSFMEFTNALGHNYRQTSFSPDVQHRLDTIAYTKRPFKYEALNVTKTGKELWTQTALVPIVDDNGEISNLVTIDADIHQRVIKSDKLIEEMEHLNAQIDHLTQQFKFLEKEFSNLFCSINELYELIEQTDQILGFIKEISDETKILGFNASIEASKAGEHGRGFRVITNTIVDISNKTITSIREIGDIVHSIKAKQNELIIRKDDSENNMLSYQELVRQLKTEVAEIKGSISEFKSLA